MDDGFGSVLIKQTVISLYYVFLYKRDNIREMTVFIKWSCCLYYASFLGVDSGIMQTMFTCPPFVTYFRYSIILSFTRIITRSCIFILFYLYLQLFFLPLKSFLYDTSNSSMMRANYLYIKTWIGSQDICIKGIQVTRKRYGVSRNRQYKIFSNVS